VRRISERRSFFAEHGWLVIRGGVDPGLLVDVRAVYDELMAPYRDGHAASLTGTALWQIPGAERARPPLLGLLRRSGLAELAADLLDDPQVRLLQEAFLLKGGGHGGRIEAHQDYSYTGYLDSPRTLGLRFPLAHETRESGCMWVVDGSHRWGLIGGVHALSDSLRDARRLLTAEQAAQLDSHRVMLEMAPGDVSIHHCLTVHGSDENRSRTPRETVVTHVVAGACRVIAGRLPSPEAVRYFPTDAAGRLAGNRFPALRSRGRAGARPTRPARR